MKRLRLLCATWKEVGVGLLASELLKRAVRPCSVARLCVPDVSCVPLCCDPLCWEDQAGNQAVALGDQRLAWGWVGFSACGSLPPPSMALT